MGRQRTVSDAAGQDRAVANRRQLADIYDAAVDPFKAKTTTGGKTMVIRYRWCWLTGVISGIAALIAWSKCPALAATRANYIGELEGI